MFSTVRCTPRLNSPVSRRLAHHNAYFFSCCMLLLLLLILSLLLFALRRIDPEGPKTKLKSRKWSGYMSGSSLTAKKLSLKRNALNLCIIILSRWNRYWVSRLSPDRCEILRPSSFEKKLPKRSTGHESRMPEVERYECRLAVNT